MDMDVHNVFEDNSTEHKLLVIIVPQFFDDSI